MKTTAPPLSTFTPTWHDWLPPIAWCCPRCAGILETREGSPRCPSCGYRETVD